MPTKLLFFRYTPEQRKERATRFLENHPVLTVSVYRKLTGLRHNAAAVELKNRAAKPGPDIDIQGEGKHLIYTRQAKISAANAQPAAPVTQSGSTG